MVTNESTGAPNDTAKKIRKSLSWVDIDEARIREVLQLPRDFAMWSDDREKFRGAGKTWSLGPTIVHRDSGIVDQSNADALSRELKRLSDLGVFSERDWDIRECSHWAVGWVKQVAFRAVDIDEDGDLHPTYVFRFLEKWFEDLREDHIADEEDYSRRQMEALAEDLQWEYRRHVGENAPADWSQEIAGDVWHESYTSDNDRLAVDKKYVIEAIRARNWLDKEESDADD